MGEDLDQRHKEILAAVVESYVKDASPVGSKTVVKRGVKLSPATVRSVMSDLEAMGMLEKPHTSAGRLPSDSGLRYYVRELQGNFSLSQEDLGRLDIVRHAEDRTIGQIIELIARRLSDISRGVGLAMVVPLESAPLKSIHLLPRGNGRIRAVFTLSDGGIEERIIKDEWNLDANTLKRLANMVNSIAPGRTLTALRRELIAQTEEARDQVHYLWARAIEVSEHLIRAREPEIFISGQANLFDLPEFSELSSLRDMVETLEEKTMLVDMLEDAYLASGTRVIIGDENKIEKMKRCSVIASAYGRGEMTAGALAVIGPTRMDYARLIPLVNFSSGWISERLNKTG